MVHVSLCQKQDFFTISSLLRGYFAFNFCNPTMGCIQKYLNTSAAYFLSCTGIIVVVLSTLLWCDYITATTEF